MTTLQIKNLKVEVEGKEILKGINLKLESGKITALMGPNGSGKSSLANAIMGNPKYKITQGEITFNNKKINDLSPTEKAKLGIFLSFQYPQEIEGVSISQFLRTSLNSTKENKISVMDFKELIDKKSKLLNLPENFQERYLNQGFSGGEKKKSEMLQLLTLDPKLAILDETDSGLDIDALKSISNGINQFMNEDKCILIITHYKRILELIKPNKVAIMSNGKIVKEGDNNLVNRLEKEGYSWLEENSEGKPSE